ncbi:MAG: YgiQ family radical SAM protein [Bdellovibrio sp. CG12_big_fil_rev_8_21_14_0_65_39_13]|nr:MAG: YgiQ family radical SAM protein [Bdellovibrio sp. CG22_combo_CG10-13_8_21_14_all_39_27]PIQ61050.1 MAG: YgiQ family radical SAM protein [Bdellovibrio sp. CG12_big_fil_rev_8_21_14_0_65_39_13]PIR36817.1 MAG: YgiQ family radical SAM protein [Bdellovibrio sp. CG11_big_fil_rev_8_21_14_0_20_39_38]PJB52815.1 MAG: YgiQ family radical SAM protein [Bdellovibrio sp. CG_4_9_14_3_um_filter_39_7]
MLEREQLPITAWLPTTAKEAKKRGWEELDIVLFTGDAYVDHPAFGAAVIGRSLEAMGLKVAIVPQPNWQDDLRDFKKFGKPNLFFAVTSGNMDSMVNKYTAGKRLRSNDAYTAGGSPHHRPDYATTIYSKILKEIYPEVPVIIGGIEASLRRVTHYDFWQDKLMPNILTSSGADLLIYGMGEQPLKEITQLMMKGVSLENLRTIPQTAFLIDQDEELPKNKKWKTRELNSHEVCLLDKKKYSRNFVFVEVESNRQFANRLIQKVEGKTLVINPPYQTMTEKEIDASFDLPYTRQPHPRYKDRGAISAYEMIKHSLNTHRGCFGGCSFCTISAHQGKMIASRSEKSILKELDAIAQMGDFKGVLSDIGGPSANMYQMKGIDQAECDRCAAPSCIFPKICTNLDTNPKPMTELYRKVNNHPKVKKAFVSSGLRYDLMLDENSPHKKEDEEYVEQLITHHVSGRLKVAPEHTEDEVLTFMRKPSFKLFAKFKEKFEEISHKNGLNQEIIPYFISSHPGCKPEDMAKLAAKTKKLGYKLEQVQDFTPTPMTVATEVYYSGYHPYTMKKVFTALSMDDKTKQRTFFFWYKPENKSFIRNYLSKLNLFDLQKELFGS